MHNSLLRYSPVPDNVLVPSLSWQTARFLIEFLLTIRNCHEEELNVSYLGVAGVRRRSP